jgi:O-antigen biosynthesis alpha-1,2-rhamnosyltransferase
MRLLIECSYVYDHYHVNSGIQRVVRNVIGNLSVAADLCEAVPVLIKNDQIYEVKRLAPLWPDNEIMLWRDRLEKTRNYYWHLHARAAQWQPFRKSRNLARLLYVVFRLFSVGYMVPFAWVLLLEGLYVNKGRAVPLQMRADDVLVLLDSSWHSDCFAVVERLKHKGMQVVAVIYDLIPITHPQFCDEPLVEVFKHWFAWIAKTADGFVFISQAIEDDARRYLQQTYGSQAVNAHWYTHFYLGSDLDLLDEAAAIRPQVRTAFEHGKPVYLMVSTIEPRKNHVYLVDTFDMLWRQGLDVCLVFVGRVGWKCDDLLIRIRAHPELNKRFFMLNDLTDAELEYCYRQSRALLFPSHVEGFGLPIVEAMQRGLQVMASDIPVFREIGGDYCAYFDFNDRGSLCGQIASFERSGIFPAIKTLQNWSWMSWKDSARQLFERISAGIAKRAVR